MATRTIAELKQLQALPLEVKVKKTELRIKEWVDAFGIDGVYVSFSGGKDSTVLLTICRNLYPDIKAVFVDTGLEYPEIRDFVRTWDNVEWLKPKMNFKKVIETYGYPFISKEVSQQVYEVRRYGRERAKWAMNKFDPNSEYNKRYNGAYSIEKYAFLINEKDAPMVSHKCCAVMKKSPTKEYEKATGRRPLIGMLAEESRLRESKWLKEGCNAFDNKRPTSNPMSFWTDQDVLHYIKRHDIKLASVYGDVVYEDADGLQYDEPLFINDMKLTTTGCKRTGCMFCGFGCQREKPGEGKFEQMKKTHPKQYEYIMKPWDEGGLNYKNVIDWINEHGNLNIRY